MSREPTTNEILTYELVDAEQFATKAALIGLCVGGGAALASGGSLTQQLLLAGVISTAVGVGLYRILCRLGERATDGTGQYRIESPAGGQAPVSDREQRVSFEDDSSLGAR